VSARWLLPAVLACLAAAGARAATPAGAAPTAEEIARGEAAFTHRCAMCHRAGQTGTFVLARRLGAEKSLLERRTDLPDAYIRLVVRQGLVNMPRISRVELPDADLAAVGAYLNRPQALRESSPSQR
jgi:mono/diheme cytochrome c family protein